MRIKSLYIEDYKNIKKQTFDFSNNSGYIALIGLNGSGKSNLLEAISLIFGELYNIKNIKSVGKFWIKYSINEEDKFYGNIDENGNSIKLEKNPNLPSPVISCYSGEDQRLWTLIYKPYYTNFFNKAIKNGPYKPDMIYIDRHCWKIALISLLYSENNEVKDFIKQLNIDSSLVTVKFTHKNIENIRPHDASNWYKRLSDNFGENDVTIDNIKSIDLNSRYTTLTDDQVIFYYLYFLSIPEKNTKEGMNADKLIKDISLKLGKIDFVDLSEGEKKLILIECITKVLGDTNSLVLLDEPDAHTHIARKDDILKVIESSEGQTLLTTHSPIFVSQMSENNIFPIVNGKLLTQDKRDLIQKIANNEINIIDGACIVSSKYVLITEGPDDIFHIKSAISAFSSKDPKYKSLEKVSFIFMGGAKEVDNYYNEILKSLYDSVNKMVFTFDYDGEGRGGAKMVQKLINDKGCNKFQYVFYHKTYPVPDPKLDFYLEDFFDKSSYRDVELPIINGTPSYAELKKSSTWADSIKKEIQKRKCNHSLGGNDYNGFQNFLDQLISSFGF